MDIYYDDIRSTKVNMVNLETKSAVYKFERYTTTTINGITTGWKHLIMMGMRSKCWIYMIPTQCFGWIQSL